MPSADLSTTAFTKTAVNPDSLLGDWHVLSAVVPVGTSSITADFAWQGTMVEFTPDSVRFHRHDLAYPASYPGETIDVTLQIHPIKYSPDGSITIAAVPFAVSQIGNSLLLRGENIEIVISRSPHPLHTRNVPIRCTPVTCPSAVGSLLYVRPPYSR